MEIKKTILAQKHEKKIPQRVVLETYKWQIKDATAP